MKKFDGTVKLGGLYFGKHEILPSPTKPWSPLLEINGQCGNIPQLKDFSSNGMDGFNIGDTPDDNYSQISWHAYTDGDKKILIADRVVLCGLSWDILKSAGYVDGKEIIVDGKLYLCRMLSGGEWYGTEPKEHGTPENEWDRFVVGSGLDEGAIELSNADEKTSADFGEQIITDHNKMWNWCGIFTWCQDVVKEYRANRALRGYYSARHWNNLPSSITNPYSGFRPALIPLSSDTLNSETTDNSLLKEDGLI